MLLGSEAARWRPLTRRGLSAVEMAHEPSAVWKLCLADSSPPGFERRAVDRADAWHFKGLEFGTVVAASTDMTQPRRYPPGSTYLLTRRVIGRHYLLQPDELVSQVYLYCLATMSEKHGIVCQGFTLLSSHSHLTLTDTRRELGAFLRTR